MPPSSGHRTKVAIPSERPRADGKPLLVVIGGPVDLGRQIDLTSGEVDIGRGEDVTFRIDSDLVSRRHASIRRFGLTFAIKDLDSTNGTLVNDKPVTTHTLVEGDRIRIGKVTLKYTECYIEAQYHEEVHQRANVDPLTQAYNKRYFEDVLRRIMESASRCALILFDIDHFKKINDTWGHPAGDAVLRKVAEVVRGRLGKEEPFCRVGGEEFAILLKDANLAVARKAAELIRTSIEQTDFVEAGQRIGVTVSVGVAERGVSDVSADALYRRADERLYEAKRGGRNRVV